jgi:hypothetical protein
MPIPKEAVPGGKGNMKIVSMKESTAFVKTIIKEFPKAKRLPLYSVWKKAEKIVTFVLFIVSMYFAVHYFQMYRQDAMPFLSYTPIRMDERFLQSRALPQLKLKFLSLLQIILYNRFLLATKRNSRG